MLSALQSSGAESWSTQLAAQIFGPLFGAGATLLSNTIGYLNVAILVVGGLLFFYNVTAALLQTAHEGEVLGKRWNSLWGPIRVIVAVGLMMPVPNLGGYNTIQAGIGYVVRGSTALATLMWSSAVPALVTGDVQVIATSPSLPTPIIAEIWKISACTALANHQLAAVGSNSNVSLVEAEHSSGAIALVSAILGQETSTAGICGSIATPSAPMHLSEVDAALFLSAHKSALSTMMAKTDLLAAKVLAASFGRDGQAVDLAGDLRQAVIDANSALSPVFELVRSAGGGEGQERLRSYLQNQEGEGWLSAGSYYLVLARLNQEAASVLSARPSVLTPARYIYEQTGSTLDAAASGRRPGWFGSASAQNLRLNEEEILRIGGDMEGAFARAAASLSSFGFGLPDPALAAALTPSQGEGGSIWDALSAAVDEVGRKLTQQIALNFSPDAAGGDPLVGLVELGQLLVGAAASILAALALASAVPVVGGAVGAAMAVVGPLLLTMTVAGGAMAVLLPAMPFVLWVLAVFGYFVTVVIAIVAAPLWTLAHMQMDGEGIAPAAAQQGYRLLLRLFLTPPLMIVGFFAAMAVFRAVSTLIGTGIYYLLSSFSGHPVFWLAAIAVMTVLTVAIFLIVIERSFSLVTSLPAAVSEWIGGGSSSNDS
ncbi:DotA/TraY family protein [Devosia chinhatensis]|uniref:DotA/TraY family protein n=1 Tax=Devosia chinhatensis TaxID=429727 RepID=A0A0F5FK74_9HYPH|nr:DotA/TraY family protein [Devosia chinhatensis]KKB09193.1 hypothetical protein VE26_04155 [Devosia chinhatensis]